MSLRARPPTGTVAYPLLLIEGEEKAGKSYAAYRLSASDHVGRSWILDIGEGTADEYARLGPYEVIDHNGTYHDMVDQLRAACQIESDPVAPNVIIVDDVTALWDLIKDWTGQRARGSKAGMRKLRDDPDAEVDISMNLWNDAKDRWNRVLNLLRSWPGIAIVIARGKEVARVSAGQPVSGESDWKVEAEKNLPSAVSAWVRMTRPHTATLIGVRSLDVDVPRNGLVLPEIDPIEHLVFEILDAGGFGAASRVIPSVGVDRGTAKTHLLAILTDAGMAEADAISAASEIWPSSNPATLSDEEWSDIETAAHDWIGAR